MFKLKNGNRRHSFIPRTIKSNITFTTLLIVIFALSVSCAVSFQVSKMMLISDFSEKSINLTKQYNGRINMYLTMLEENFNIITENNIVKEALITRDVNTNVLPVLHGVLDSNISIIGISVYGLDNNSVYTTNTIPNPPPLSHLIKYHIPKDFIDSDRNMCNVIRADNLSPYYDGVRYAVKSNGLYTFIKKITDNDKIIGLMVVDIPLANLFEFYNNPDRFIDVWDVFIVDSNNQEYISPNNTHSSEQYKKIEHLFVSDRIQDYDNQIRVYIPVYTLNNRLLLVLAQNILYCLVILLICIFATKILVKSIIDPMKQLKEEVKQDLMEGESND